MRKRIISILLILVMVLGLLPTMAFAADLPFTDVPKNAWYYSDVENAVASGLVNGKTATTYGPDDNLTYAEAVKLAACMWKEAMTGSTEFEPSNPWYQTYVDYAKANKIISCDYSWNTAATRAGYMEIFANSMPDTPGLGTREGLKAINNIPDGAIPDVPMTHSQADAIYKLYRAGIVQGSDKAHSCKPNDNIKRSEVAAILTRMLNASKRISFSMGNTDELTIIEQPQTLTLDAVNHTGSLSVTVVGGKAPYSYQWYKEEGNIKINDGELSSAQKHASVEGSITDKLTFRNALQDGWKGIPGTFYCVITDAAGKTVTSKKVTVSVNVGVASLAITQQPVNAEAAEGGSATFSVAVSGGKAPYTYQWYVGSDTPVGGSNYSGLTTQTLTVKNVDDSFYGNLYYCVITDADGSSITSNRGLLTVTESTFRVTKQPANAEAAYGGSAIFSVGVYGGKAPYTYQWYVGSGTPVSGANYSDTTTSSLIVKNVDDSFYGNLYYCVITDTDGNSVTSNRGLLTVGEKLTITNKLGSVNVLEGGSHTFTVQVTGGTAPYTYNWYSLESGTLVNSNNYSGIKTASLTIKNIPYTFDGCRYGCAVTDADGNTVTSNAATLLVTPNPS